jgi:hypothetical protein
LQFCRRKIRHLLLLGIKGDQLQLLAICPEGS